MKKVIIFFLLISGVGAIETSGQRNDQKTLIKTTHWGTPGAWFLFENQSYNITPEDVMNIAEKSDNGTLKSNVVYKTPGGGRYIILYPNLWRFTVLKIINSNHGTNITSLVDGLKGGIIIGADKAIKHPLYNYFISRKGHTGRNTNLHPETVIDPKEGLMFYQVNDFCILKVNGPCMNPLETIEENTKSSKVEKDKPPVEKEKIPVANLNPPSEVLPDLPFPTETRNERRDDYRPPFPPLPNQQVVYVEQNHTGLYLVTAGAFITTIVLVILNHNGDDPVVIITNITTPVVVPTPIIIPITLPVTTPTTEPPKTNPPVKPIVETQPTPSTEDPKVPPVVPPVENPGVGGNGTGGNNGSGNGTGIRQYPVYGPGRLGVSEINSVSKDTKTETSSVLVKKVNNFAVAFQKFTTKFPIMLNASFSFGNIVRNAKPIFGESKFWVSSRKR